MSFRLLATCVTLAVAAPVAAQNACEPGPRWLVVTKVGFELLGDDETTGDAGDLADMMRDVGLGVSAIDLCDGHISISETDVDRSGGRAQTLIQRRRQNSQGEFAVLEWHFIRESIHDICEVLESCADATGGEP